MNPAFPNSQGIPCTSGNDQIADRYRDHEWPIKNPECLIFETSIHKTHRNNDDPLISKKNHSGETIAKT